MSVRCLIRTYRSTIRRLFLCNSCCYLPLSSPHRLMLLLHFRQLFRDAGIFLFFFQAEDGIRDVAVTGVQTCALPISLDPAEAMAELENATRLDAEQLEVSETIAQEIPLIGYVGGDEEGSDLGASSNEPAMIDPETDRKSTRLNSSHGYISYAVFCLKKQNIMQV